MSAAENKEVQAVNPRPLLAFLSAAPIACYRLVDLWRGDYSLPGDCPGRPPVQCPTRARHSRFADGYRHSPHYRRIPPISRRRFLPDSLAVWIVAGILFGLGIGLVSSLLGVAGGELIIPTLVFALGVGIKTAGTASLLISLPTVAVGVLRHRKLGSFV